MPSPFPGMDPYLEHESVFHGFHQKLIVEISNALVPRIRPNYIADTDVNVYIHELSGHDRLVGRPDVHVVDSGKRVPVSEVVRSSTPRSDIVPLISTFSPAVDVVEIPYVKIIDRVKREVVTVIEVLSPTNKLKGDDRAAYIAKRNTLRRSWAHLIEIDLLRAGEPMPLVTQPEADYRILLSRQEQRPEVMIWPINLRDQLPTIPVPLKSPYPDVLLDLQEVFSRVYDASAYSDYVYETPPQPAMKDADSKWGMGILREAGMA